MAATAVPTQNAGIPEQITAAHSECFWASSTEDTPGEGIFHFSDASVSTAGQALKMAIIGATRALGMGRTCGPLESGKNAERSLTSLGVVLP